MFKRIDHVEIVTDKPEETEAFYTEVLGFRVRARDRIERPGSASARLRSAKSHPRSSTSRSAGLARSVPMLSGRSMTR